MTVFDRQRFIADTRALVTEGVPFVHQSRNAAVGLDCINAPANRLELQGIKLPFDFPPYHTDSHNCELIESIMREHLIEVEREEAAAADLYLFRIGKRKRHIGTRVTDDVPPLMVHMFSHPYYRAVEMPLDESWTQRLIAVFRIPDFKEGT